MIYQFYEVFNVAILRTLSNYWY